MRSSNAERRSCRRGPLDLAQHGDANRYTFTVTVTFTNPNPEWAPTAEHSIKAEHTHQLARFSTSHTHLLFFFLK